MNRLRSIFSIYLMIGLVIFGVAAQADAQNRRNNREMRDIVQSLNSKIDDFRYNLDSESRRTSNNRNNQNEINDNLRDLEDSISQFEGKFQRRRESADDVTSILEAAKNINDFVSRSRFNGKAAGDWTNVRGLLDRLASNYNVRWNWNDGNSNYPNNNRYPNDNRYPNNNRYPNDNRYPPTNSSGNNLTGTYQLDTSRSENTRDIADRAIRNGNVRNNPDAQRDLESKLEAPAQIAVDVRGNQVTLASSNSKQITFTADGRDRTETLDDGRTLRVRSTLRGQELTVSSLGGDNDYTVVFAPVDNGNALRVTRQITANYLRQTVFAESIYRKTDATARLNDYDNSNGDYSSNDGTYSSNDPNNNRNNYPTARTGRTGTFIVRNGAVLTGTLDNNIDTKVSQNNDRFRMTVTEPNEYRGAVVEGYLSGIDRSGKISGRSQVTFNFERIRLSNGQTYDFSGILQSVTNEKGEVVKIDNEGVAKGDSQTKETIKRGGIGAGIGAIIGAIAGGGKGAAIGAIIGGGAGAGSVIVQGKDDLELKSGSTITVESSSPIR
ncbi:MAG: hypothetical protein ACR2MG_03685 [Pyrinomonadaceae bacterium]